MRELICDACERGPQPCFDGHNLLGLPERLCLSCCAQRARIWEKIARQIADDEGVECPEPEDAF